MAEVDPQGLLAIMIGGLIAIIPIAGFTARFALKPLIEAWARARGGGEGNFALAARVQLLEHRIVELETAGPLTTRTASLLGGRAGSS